MTKFLIIDTSHMMHRARHSTQGDIWMKAGLALHIMLNSIKKSWNDFEADHVVFCLDGSSWRKTIYEPYKKNRTVQRMKKSVSEQEDDTYFYEVVNDFTKFIAEKTNCTVLHNPIAEADDLIARWVQTHPDDSHVIVSGDTDFIQMLADNCVMYDGINDRTLTAKGVFDDKGRPLEFTVDSSSKLKVKKHDVNFAADPDWVEWAMFVKYIRGDTSDNIFSAFPKARMNKIRMVFEDRDDKGFEWNNFMLSKWVDHNQKQHRVKDRFQENYDLINLAAQPPEIIETLDDTIQTSIDANKHIANIGFQFMKFANKYELVKVLQFKEGYLKFLTAAYSEE